MKLGSVTKIDRRNTITSKRVTMTSCWRIITSLLFFQFKANLGKSACPIPDATSVKLTFSLIVVFYFTKTGKKLKTIAIALNKGILFAKKGFGTKR